jgi:hypothetical protein
MHLIVFFQAFFDLFHLLFCQLNKFHQKPAPFSIQECSIYLKCEKGKYLFPETVNPESASGGKTEPRTP